MSEKIADDLLRGAPQIAEFTGEPIRRVYDLLEAGSLPAGKMGSQWVASRRKLRAYYDKITGEV